MAASNKVSTKSHASTSPLGRVRAVLLAAGGSRRMGEAKALLALGGRAVIARHVDALAVVADPIVAVLGAEADRIGAALPDGVIRVVNARWAETSPIDSVLVGIRALPSDAAPDRPVLVTPIDVVPALPDTLHALIASFVASGRSSVPVGRDGARGHPVLLDPATARAICVAPPKDGLRGALADAALVPVADPWVAADFDDPAAFAAIAAATADRRR